MNVSTPQPTIKISKQKPTPFQDWYKRNPPADFMPLSTESIIAMVATLASLPPSLLIVWKLYERLLAHQRKLCHLRLDLAFH